MNFLHEVPQATVIWLCMWPWYVFSGALFDDGVNPVLESLAQASFMVIRTLLINTQFERAH